MAPKVVVSYEATQKSFAVVLWERLQEAGFDARLGADETGSSVEGGFRDARLGTVAESLAVIACVSQTYDKCENCRTDVEGALNADTPIIPLVVDPLFNPVDHRWLWARIGQNLVIDFTNPDEFDDNFRSLADELARLIHGRSKWAAEADNDEDAGVNGKGDPDTNEDIGGIGTNSDEGVNIANEDIEDGGDDGRDATEDSIVAGEDWKCAEEAAENQPEIEANRDIQNEAEEERHGEIADDKETGENKDNECEKEENVESQNANEAPVCDHKEDDGDDIGLRNDREEMPVAVAEEPEPGVQQEADEGWTGVRYEDYSEDVEKCEDTSEDNRGSACVDEEGKETEEEQGNEEAKEEEEDKEENKRSRETDTEEEFEKYEEEKEIITEKETEEDDRIEEERETEEENTNEEENETEKDNRDEEEKETKEDHRNEEEKETDEEKETEEEKETGEEKKTGEEKETDEEKETEEEKETGEEKETEVEKETGEEKETEEEIRNEDDKDACEEAYSKSSDENKDVATDWSQKLKELVHW